MIWAELAGAFLAGVLAAILALTLALTWLSRNRDRVLAWYLKRRLPPPSSVQRIGDYTGK